VYGADHTTGTRSWSWPATVALISVAISGPTAGAFLNWFPLVPIATKNPGNDVLS
jgi:hypothetical protein